MHSQRVIAIYLQDTNATFYKVVQRHYSGEVGNVYISYDKYNRENTY